MNVTKNQDVTVSLENNFFVKPYGMGQVDPSSALVGLKFKFCTFWAFVKKTHFEFVLARNFFVNIPFTYPFV